MKVRFLLASFLMTLSYTIAQDTPAPTPALSVAQEQSTNDKAPTEQGSLGCGSRIRKSWDRMTDNEKDVYIRAIERSMDDGLYIKFVEAHTEQMSTAEAHRTCMFVYWHREFLLGYENMLRSYGGEFSCITVPYWNYVDHNARFMLGACGSMEDCSPILQELGGSSGGTTRTVTVNGTPASGQCVTRRPANHFCESSTVNGQQCARCIPRGDWLSSSFPPTTSVSSLMRQLFETLTIDAVATNLEQGVHNTMHNALGGVMSLLEATADPIFFSHHAVIDLLHSIFYHCAVGNTESMSLESKLQDSRQFVAQCPRRQPLSSLAMDRNVLLPESSIMMRTSSQGAPSQSVRDPQHPLARFFATLPDEYLSLSDIRDIGDLSYNYEMSGLLADMYTNCLNVEGFLGPLLSGADAAANMNVPNGFGGPGVGFAPGQAQFGGPGQFGTGLGVGGSGQFGGFTTGLGVGGPNAFGGFRQLQSSPLVEAVIVRQEDEDSNSEWYREALGAAINATRTSPNNVARVSNNIAQAMKEVEKMTCMFYDECRGPVQDLSATFRRSFNMTATMTSPCYKVVQDIKHGRDTIKVPEWKTIMLRYLQC